MPESQPKSRLVSRLTTLILLAGLLLLAYPAYQWWVLRHAPAAPKPAPEVEIDLTPAEQAEFESNLYALMPRMLVKDATIEKVYKDGKGFVMVVKSGDTRMTLRMERDMQPANPASPPR